MVINVVVCGVEFVQCESEASGGDGTSSNRVCPILPMAIQQHKWGMCEGDKQHDNGIQLCSKIHSGRAS